MGLDLDSLKKHLDAISDEFKLKIVKEIGDLANDSSSVVDFKNKLDELCEKYLNKTSSELMAEFNVRLANTNVSPTPTPTENAPLQNEIDKVKGKLDNLKERDEASKS